MRLFGIRFWGLLGLFVLFGCRGKEDAPKPKLEPAVPVRYGIELRCLKAVDTTIPNGATFSTLLGNWGFPATVTQKVVDASKGVFDLRKLKARDSLTVIRDSISGKVCHLILRPDPYTYVRFDLDSIPRVAKIAFKVDTVRRVVDGAITASLWEDMIRLGHSPTLVGRMADILACQVDFFAIQPGDKFRMVYDELRVDGRAVGQGQIHGVSFLHSGELAQAFHFQHGGISGYYDEQGRPMRRAFLKAPLQFSRISSHFTSARMHPVLRIVRPHYGVDYAAPTGTPVMAVGDGTVLSKGWGGGGGNCIKIRHDNGCMTGYMHLNAFAKGIGAGKHVRQGELIGWVGMTGLATGPHLDFRFWKNGTPVDPLHVISPPAPPLPNSLLAVFHQSIAGVNLGLTVAGGKSPSTQVKKS
jgi:Peptidase family M23/Csd3 second domain